MQPNKDLINILFYNDVRSKSTSEEYVPAYLADYVPTYLVNRINLNEQNLILKVQQLASQGMNPKQIMQMTNLNKYQVAEYLRRKAHPVTSLEESFEVSYAPITDRYTLREIEGLGYDFDELDDQLKAFFQSEKVTLQKGEDGLYKKIENVYGSKTV